MSKITAIIKPVAEELGHLTKTAGEQIVGTSKSSEEETKEVVKHLYGKKDQKELKPDEIIKQKERDKEELEKKRKALQMHTTTYYQPLVNRPKPKEETPVERVEKQKMQELQVKEAKKPPPIVQRSAQRVEKYRGASG